MKCPICGQQLKPGKKDPSYLLCYNCKKKFKAPSDKVRKKEQTYSNIPPKNVRDKREEEMRKAYDEMLAVGDGKKKKAQPQPKRKEVIEDDDYEYEDEKLSKAPIIILGIAIIVVIGIIAYVALT